MEGRREERTEGEGGKVFERQAEGMKRRRERKRWREKTGSDFRGPR